MGTVEALKAFLDVANSKDPPSYEQAAAALQVSVGAVKTLIHRLRKQYTALVREEIGHLSSGVAVRWGLLIKRSTSICDTP